MPSLTYDSIAEMIYAAPDRDRETGVFICDLATLQDLRLLKDHDGRYLIEPGLQPYPFRIFDRPLLVNQDHTGLTFGPATRQPRAFRPARNLLLAAADLLSDDSYLLMSRDQFIGRCLQASGGSINPADASSLYDELMEDAGLPPLERPAPAPAAKEYGDGNAS